MSFDKSLFDPNTEFQDPEGMVRAALATIEGFTERFNARDLVGMDAHLHFPHVILSADKLVIWETPGQLPSAFFQELERETGWHHTEYLDRRVVLVSVRKVHFLVDYTRNRSDCSVISRHLNLWIVTFFDDRWGIKQRSY